MNTELLATLTSGLFAGGAGFISLVEHPARMKGGTAFAVREFRPSFGRAHRIMASLALFGSLFGLTAWIQGTRLIWLIGGLAMVANGPWTYALIMPVNRQLLDPDLDVSSERASRLMVRWGRLHWVRTLLGCVGFVLFGVALSLRS